MADPKIADAKSADPKIADPKAGDARPANPDGKALSPAAQDAAPAPAAPSADIKALADAIGAANRLSAGAAVARPDADKTVPGGKFLDVRTGKFINCNGREIDEDGKILRPEELTMDPFGRLV
jgi:hypothetical protein